MPARINWPRLFDRFCWYLDDASERWLRRHGVFLVVGALVGVFGWLAVGARDDLQNQLRLIEASTSTTAWVYRMDYRSSRSIIPAAIRRRCFVYFSFTDQKGLPRQGVDRIPSRPCRRSLKGRDIEIVYLKDNSDVSAIAAFKSDTRRERFWEFVYRWSFILLSALLACGSCRGIRRHYWADAVVAETEASE